MRKLFLLLIFLPALSNAQRNFSLLIIPSDKDSSFLTHDFSYKKSFGDTLTRHKELQSVLNKLYSKGYLESSFDKFIHDSTRLNATLSVGKPWEWASLQNGNVDILILDRIGFRQRLYEDKPLQLQQINQVSESILGYCENNGYPFASVHLDSISISDQKLKAKLFLDKNQLITIDSLNIVGDAKIAKVYLANYIGFHFPSIYKEDVIRRMSSRIRELPFCSEARAAEVIFNGDRASINLFLNKKEASRFDFILGVLPNSNSTGKLLITGDGTLSLVNPFGRGESIFLSFSALQPRTSQVILHADYPYLFNIPFGIDVDFNLYKNDTLYIDVKEQIGLKYLFTGVNYFKFYFRNASSSILNFDTAQVIQTKQLPPYLDYQTQSYGVEYRAEHLDYRFNPSRGWNLLVNAEAGNRKVKENSQITQLTDPSDPSFVFSSLYDSVSTTEAQYIFHATLQKYWPLGSRNVILTAYHGAGIISKDILQNELFRIGGFQLLRGFDEQSIYASQYHIGTVEYHYLLSQNSFFYLFFDGAYVQNQNVAPIENDYPYGFGAGINFETKAGIFSLSYALGAQQNNPIQFRSAKIHFGYVNYF